jgi:hypothetical protein
LFIIAIVWFFVYLSRKYSRRRHPKNEQDCLASIYTTQDSTIAGGGSGYETSIAISSLDL